MSRVLLAGLLLVACVQGPTQLPLTGTDGCSGVPDVVLRCCISHDEGYRWGGPWGDWSERGRYVEDVKLHLCMLLERDVSRFIADGFFRIVRGEAGRRAWEQNRKMAGRPDPGWRLPSP